jgi:hypothetical protein
MPKPISKATVVVTGTNLHFPQPGDYTIDYLPSGNVKIQVDGGHSYVMGAAEYASIKSFSFADGASLGGPVQVNGVSFTEAGPGGPFEVSPNLDSLIGEMISTHGIEYTAEHLLINGSAADTFKVLWDYLDDAYVAGNNYYNLPLNETFARLGLEYAEYLEAGGEPLTFITAKYASDSNANGIPQREQSMHDNLLGNITTASIEDRFSGALEAELLALAPDEYQDRPYYDGNEPRVGGAIHDAIRAFDYDHGWDRPDYIDRSYNGLIDPLARDAAAPNSMYYGNGNPVDDWNLVRHEGAQVELGLKVKHRGGDEYAEASIGPDGVAHYNVAAGPQAGSPNRAEWNFDFAATDYSPDTEFTYVVELDVDPGAGEDFVTIYSSDAPLDTDFGNGSTFQNSFNVAFVDTDPATPGTQHYGFGPAEFNVRISAYDGSQLVLTHEVIVHVGA